MQYVRQPLSQPVVARRSLHPNCIACGQGNGDGLGLEFRQNPDGSIEASFTCDPRYQGYEDCVHGGVIAMLLDAAMTNCLFAQGVAGVTARLIVAYRKPVLVSEPATIHASVVERNRMLYLMKAELQQQGTIKAHAEGKFVSRSD